MPPTRLAFVLFVLLAVQLVGSVPARALITNIADTRLLNADASVVGYPPNPIVNLSDVGDGLNPYVGSILALAEQTEPANVEAVASASQESLITPNSGFEFSGATDASGSISIGGGSPGASGSSRFIVTFLLNSDVFFNASGLLTAEGSIPLLDGHAKGQVAISFYPLFLPGAPIFEKTVAAGTAFGTVFPAVDMENVNEQGFLSADWYGLSVIAETNVATGSEALSAHASFTNFVLNFTPVPIPASLPLLFWAFVGVHILCRRL